MFVVLLAYDVGMHSRHEVKCYDVSLDSCITISINSFVLLGIVSTYCFVRSSFPDKCATTLDEGVILQQLTIEHVVQMSARLTKHVNPLYEMQHNRFIYRSIYAVVSFFWITIVMLPLPALGIVSTCGCFSLPSSGVDTNTTVAFDEASVLQQPTKAHVVQMSARLTMDVTPKELGQRFFFR